MSNPNPTAASLPHLFSLAIDPRERLLLFDIADDPDYVAMETQVFDDATHGRGVLVLLARHDGLVDIYFQAGLRLERGPFSIGRGIGEWRTTEISPARLQIGPDGVDLEVGLFDAAGRRIQVRIDDRDGVARNRSTLLAPVGSGVVDPRQFFVVLLRDFDLVRTSGPAPRLAIDGQPRTVRSFPGPAWLTRRRFIRYSGDPVIAILNPAFDGPIEPSSLGPVLAVTAADGATEAAVRFEPAVPDLRSLASGTQESGRWWMDVADTSGLTGGSWSAERRDHLVELSLVVTQPWRPRDLPWSLRAVTTLARVFREWPTTYRWTASVDLTVDPPALHSRWDRTSPMETANPYRVRRPSRGVLAAGAVVVAALVARSVGRGLRHRR